MHVARLSQTAIAARLIRLAERIAAASGGITGTQSKMAIARHVYHLLHAVGFRDEQLVTRGGVRFALDLREGIDLSIFLAGAFQRHVTALRGIDLPPNPVLFDVGANIGAISLAWLHAFPEARVFAFEPTNYAYEKLLTNLNLNQSSRSRIDAVQTFISSTASRQAVPDPHASWRVDDAARNRHPVHQGEAKPATERVTTLDAFVQERGLARVDLIKIDTDGHELEVLLGGANTLRAHRPILVFEVGPYLLDEHGVDFKEYEQLLLPLGYALQDAASGKVVSHTNLRKIAPNKGTLDVLARARR